MAGGTSIIRAMVTDDHRRVRPRWLAAISLAAAAALTVLAVRAGTAAFGPPPAFDIVFGALGAMAMLLLAAALWRRRRGVAAWALALAGWSGLTAAVTVRLALFARADYDRARLPFFGVVTVTLLATAVVAGLWHRRRGRPS
ncbi:MAG: hypothetical protein IPM16_17410 [Chloroflexi bacterium]|nr:hypothetical protein [Chloroflexota bacterium]